MIDYIPTHSISERHINTVGALLLLLMFGCVAFTFTFHREQKNTELIYLYPKELKEENLR